MGLIIGPEVSERKDLPPSRVRRARAPMPFMFPMRNGPSSAAAGKHPPGRLTEVGWLARMPLSGGASCLRVYSSTFDWSLGAGPWPSPSGRDG
jgi:hypothetical protein